MVLKNICLIIKTWRRPVIICFILFYGISTIVGYLMSKPFLYIKTILFQIIQFSISIQFSSIWSIDRTLSDATSLGQSGLRSDGNNGVSRIPWNSKHYWSLTIRLLSVISKTLVGVGVLLLCWDAVGVFYSSS